MKEKEKEQDWVGQQPLGHNLELAKSQPAQGRQRLPDEKTGKALAPPHCSVMGWGCLRGA